MIPHLLLLGGAPATGKSQLSLRLAERYGACLCSKDEIKERLFDVLGTGDAAHSRRLSDASFALLFAFAARLLAPERLLILEGNFRPGEHEPALLAALRGGRVEWAQVLCTAEAAVRAARLAARAADSARHPGHRMPTLDADAAHRADFLDLAGPRWRYRSDAGGESEWQGLCQRLDGWCGPRLSAVHKQ